jgi:hypothetical protein
MSRQPAPNPASAPALPAQTVRILTPVYDFKLEGADSFAHAGPYKGANFKVVLRPYTGPADLDALVNLAHPNNRPSIRQGFRRFDTGAAGCHVLLIEVALPGSAFALDMGIATEVQLSTVETLRLHSTAGLPHDDPLMFSDAAILAQVRWISRQSPISHLPKPSVLRSDDFAACRATGDTLRSKAWGGTTFDKVVGLAKEYHRLSFTLEKVEHAFLILMVAYEAMFLRDGTENASKPAQRIGRLLGATKKDCQGIQRDFNDDPDSFSKIRNQIAHGDPNLNLATVASKYPSLCRHLTAAIVRLLALPPGSLDDTKDYYDEITRLTESRFFSLPNS